MTTSLLDKTAIVGIGQTEFSKESGRSELQLAAEACRAAMVDAGLTKADVDGLVTFTVDTNDEVELMRCLGLPVLRWTARAPFGGGGASATIQMAAAAVASGAARAVLVYRAFNERSGRRFGQPMGGPGGYSPWGPGPDFHVTYGLDTPAKIYSMWYARYMQKYGVTNEDLGHYVVTARRHAATNPKAWFYQRPITLADHQASRWIVEPILRLMDCCQESDGGVAMIVTSAERARDLRQPGVRIVAANQAHIPDSQVMFNYYLDDLAEFEDGKLSAADLWRTSGLSPKDMDVAMLYENFSPIVFMSLEAFGFCGPGEAKDFIKEGHIGLDGSLPVNPNGGLLGEAYIHGMNNIIEAVRQLRGTAANQIADVDYVLNSSGRSAAIFGRL